LVALAGRLGDEEISLQDLTEVIVGMDQHSPSSSDWRKKWANNQGAALDPIIEYLIDLDLRIASLPTGETQNNLMQWLDRIASRQAGPPQGNNQYAPISILQNYVAEVQFYYRNFRAAQSIAWLIGVVVWHFVGYFLYNNVSNFIRPLFIPSNEVGDQVWQLWFLIFIAGVAGSAIAGLWRIYTEQFDYERAITDVPYKETDQPVYLFGLDKYFGLIAPPQRVRHFFALVVPALPRALVRPPLGGLFAWGITLILLSGLILAPLIEPFVTPNGGVDMSKLITFQANLFFLTVGVISGFSEEFAINLLGRAVGTFDSKEDR
jgi:hypothetical protein